MDYYDFIERIYDLEPDELRKFAYECLLISDGPNHIGPNTTTPEGKDALMALWPLYKDVPLPMMNWKEEPLDG